MPTKAFAIRERPPESEPEDDPRDDVAAAKRTTVRPHPTGPPSAVTRRHRHARMPRVCPPRVQLTARYDQATNASQPWNQGSSGGTAPPCTQTAGMAAA